MTTYIYGGSPADVVTDTDGNVLAGIELQVYATASSLAPVAGLAQKTGDTYKPVYRLKTDTEGRYQFTSGAGPTLWIETASSGKRWRIEAWQTTTEKLADLLNIKTVTRTLTPGSTANVQVAATANDLTFNFAIPTGTQGPRGLKGEPGKDGPDEDAIAEYFRRAASQPMQALAELGVPRPYASKTAIDAIRYPSQGVLAKDISTGRVWCWDGTMWKIWETPPGENATDLITAVPRWWEFVSQATIVRHGICHHNFTMAKAGDAWNYSPWDSDPIANIAPEAVPFGDASNSAASNGMTGFVLYTNASNQVALGVQKQNGTWPMTIQVAASMTWSTI